MGVDYEKLEQIQKVLISNSKNELLNQFIEAKIIKYENLYNYYHLYIIFNGIQCNQFIISKKEFSTEFKEIKIKLEDIKVKMIKNKNYIEIKHYNVISKNLTIQKTKLYEFKLPQMIEDLRPINSFENICVILKAKEKDLITSYSYTFYNYSNSNILIDSLNDFSDIIENGKCYLFNGFNFYNNTLISTNISSIEIIDQNSIIEDIKFPENINKCNNNDIINLKGNIIDLIIENFTVIIEDTITKNNIEIILNLDLVNKINPNSICQFIRFKKINNRKFIYTNLSDIF